MKEVEAKVEAAAPDLSKLGPDLPGSGTSRASPELDTKIRNVCLILSVWVVFNHARTLDMEYTWEGLRVSSMPEGYFASAPVEILIQHFFSGALGRLTNPVFFMASGFLFFYGWNPSLRSWGGKLRKRIFTLLCPYLIWSMVGMLMNFGAFLGANGWRVLRPEVRGPVSIWEMAAFVFNMPMPGQLWFLWNLMLMMVFAVPLIAVLLKALRRWVVPVVLIYYFMDLPNPGVDKAGLCFFSAGAFLGSTRSNLAPSVACWRQIAVALWILLAVIYTGLSLGTELPLQPLFRLMVLAGIAGLWALYDWIPKGWRGRLDRMAPYRFFIYMGFDPLLTLLQRKWVAEVPPSQGSNLLGYILLPVIVIAVDVAVARFLKRRVSKFYYFITGGR